MTDALTILQGWRSLSWSEASIIHPLSEVRWKSPYNEWTGGWEDDGRGENMIEQKSVRERRRKWERRTNRNTELVESNVVVVKREAEHTREFDRCGGMCKTHR